MKNICFTFYLIVLSLFGQAQGIYNNGAQIVAGSGSGSYWVVSKGNFTLTSIDAINPATMDNLKILSDGTLTLAPTTCLTVNNKVSNENTTGSGLVVKSTNAGTGSLIASSATATGIASAERYISAGKWNLVSSPVGQSVSNFLASNTAIATNGTTRSMMDFNSDYLTWNPLFTSGSGNGSVGAGKGFAMHLGAANAAVTSSGSLQAGTVTISGLPSGSWVCIGNPYTSAIGVNAEAPTTDDFLNANVLANSNIDPSYGAIYIAEKTDAANNKPGGYTIISNVPLTSATNSIPQGQAFMVKLKPGSTSITFNKNMQLHSPTLALKAGAVAWPIIKLNATIGTLTGQSIIAFNDLMTHGLDPTFDVSYMKIDNDLAIYTRLVNSNGEAFAMQALPGSNISKLVIPVGLESKSGGPVVFSAQTFGLPADCKVILEDLVTNTFTDLQSSNYKVTVAPNSVILNRFQLRTGVVTVDPGPTAGDMIAYLFHNAEIRIEGEVTSEGVAKLYDTLGRLVLTQKLNPGGLNIVPTSSVSSGMYLLKVADKGTLHTFKFLIRQ
jgi:hypothetical protein